MHEDYFDCGYCTSSLIRGSPYVLGSQSTSWVQTASSSNLFNALPVVGFSRALQISC